MKHIITLALVMFPLFVFADDDERKGRRDDRQEEYIETVDEKHKGGAVDKAEDVIDVDHEEHQERQDDRQEDFKKKK